MQRWHLYLVLLLLHMTGSNSRAPGFFLSGVCMYDADARTLTYRARMRAPPASGIYCTLRDTCATAHVKRGPEDTCICSEGYTISEAGDCEPATPEPTALAAPEPESDDLTTHAVVVPPSVLLQGPGGYDNITIYHTNTTSVTGETLLGTPSPQMTSSVVAAAALPTCTDSVAATTCALWKASGYCGMLTYLPSTGKYIATALCPLTCGRCGCRDERLFMNPYNEQPGTSATATRCQQWKNANSCLGNSANGWFTDTLSGTSMPIGSFWCPATCGTCAGPESSWTSGTSSGRQITVGGVGVYVTKSTAALTQHVLPFLELHAGAHYYVHTDHVTTWNESYATAFLPGFKRPSGSTRIACVALNALSGGGGIDFGLENEGQGWFAFAYGKCGGVEMKFRQPPYPTAAKAKIWVQAGQTSNEDFIIATWWIYDADGYQLTAFGIKHEMPRGACFPYVTTCTYNCGPNKARPQVRFGRFMSLLHDGGNDYALGDKADGSEMLNYKFTNLILYNWGSATWQPWDRSRIAHAWHVQTQNFLSPGLAISTSTAPMTDTCNMKQLKQYI